MALMYRKSSPAHGFRWVFCSCSVFFFFFNDTATTEIYTLSLHDALPIFQPQEFVEALGAEWKEGIQHHLETVDYCDGGIQRRRRLRPVDLDGFPGRPGIQITVDLLGQAKSPADSRLEVAIVQVPVDAIHRLPGALEQP